MLANKSFDFFSFSKYFFWQDDGTVFMWGVKWCKEFDPSVELGTVLSQFVPTQIPFSNFGGKKVIFGSNGKYHAVFVTDDSIVWTFGYNNLGQAKNNK